MSFDKTIYHFIKPFYKLDANIVNYDLLKINIPTVIHKVCKQN